MSEKHGTALYATDVSHYDHVVESMSNVYNSVDLIKRWEPTPEMTRWAVRWHAPPFITKLLERRTRHSNDRVRKNYTLKLSTILPAFTIHTGHHLLPGQAGIVAKLKASKVSKVSKVSANYQLVQFVEGLGHKYLTDHPAKINICESRTHHYGHFQGLPTPYLAYPAPAPYKVNLDALKAEHQRADKILVYSSASKRSFIQNGVEESKIVVCPLPVNISSPRLNMARDKTSLLFVGRSDRVKGLDLAVAVAQALGEPYTLWVAGPMDPAVQSWMKQFPFVKYLGIQTQEELKTLYSSSLVYLAPSHESFGLTAAEAVYHGCHLVCSDWTGIAEYLPENRVTIVQGRNVHTWSQHAKAAISQWTTPDYESINQAFEPLSAVNVANKLQRIYESIESE